jgi:hypothetical protein
MQIILSEDLLIVCLFLAKGDTGKNITEIISLAENYQVENNRHFGTTRDDFRNLFYLLGVSLEAVTYNDILEDKAWKILTEISLQNWISNILEYKDTYFNDEGASWCESETHEVSDKNQLMRDFFSNRTNLDSDEVIDFLTKNSFSRDALETCSRPGESS